MRQLIVFIICLLASVSLVYADTEPPSYMGNQLGEPVTITSSVSGKIGTATLYSGDSQVTGFEAEIIEYDSQTFVVRGALYDMWKTWGKQDKRFGFPVSEQSNFGGSEDWRQNFEGGYLIYRHASNVVMVYPDGYIDHTGGYGLGKTPPKVEQAFADCLDGSSSFYSLGLDHIQYENKGVKDDLDYYYLPVDHDSGWGMLIYNPTQHEVHFLTDDIANEWKNGLAQQVGLPVQSVGRIRDWDGGGETIARVANFQHGIIWYDLQTQEFQWTVESP